MNWHPGHPHTPVEWSPLEWLAWIVPWVAGFYLDLVLVFSPFLLARLWLGRWPWPLTEHVDAVKPNYGPMRPRDGLMWSPPPDELPRSFYTGDDD